MKALSKLLKKRKKVIWNWKECHISCLNHVIDLGVQAFLKSIKILEEEVEEAAEAAPIAPEVITEKKPETPEQAPETKPKAEAKSKE